MKIEIAQIQTDPGCIQQNTTKIIETIKQAKAAKVDLVIFPELTIPGYMSMDLVLYQEYIQDNLRALRNIVSQTKNIAAIVGFIDQDKNKLGPDGTPIRYNSAAIIDDGKLLRVEDKTLLPDYDVFYENRYFATARNRQVYNLRGIKVGVEICEDLWDTNYPVKVSDDLVQKGAEVLINLSASPFHIGKRSQRSRIIKQLIAKHHLPFFYANTVGGQDGYDGELVLDGQSMIFDSQGELIKLGKAFAEDKLIVEFPLSKNSLVQPSCNPTQELYQALVLGIKDYFRRSGFRKAFIGLSGGIDSAVVAALAATALGSENVTGVSMPSRFSSEGSKDDALELASNLGITFRTIPIENIFNSFRESLAKDFAAIPTDVTEENLQARIRGALLMAEANKFNGLVLSTGNKTETALGYTTLYGDMCGGLAAISDVSKLRVYDLARYINHQAGKTLIPESSITKPPSAELSEGQTDEKGLGAAYDIISPLVDEIIEEGKTFPELAHHYPSEIVQRVISLITRNEYKRRQAPPGIKVTKKAFGVGRRVPINHSFRYERSLQ